MKITMMVIFLLIVLVPAVFFVRGFMSRSGTAPSLVNGQLTTCPDKPNCVCSETGPESASFITPISLPANQSAQAWTILKATIVEQGGQLRVEKDSYFAATFTSAVFGFVDDLEARLDADRGVIQLRSASRVGHSDFGVNRKRVELIKRRFAEKFSETEAHSSG